MATWADETMAQALAIAASKGPAQAARETGIPVGTIKSRLHRQKAPDATPQQPDATPAQPQGTTPVVARETAPGRDASGRFLPGVSGNPSGQTSAVREAKRRAEEYAPAIIDELMALARNPAVDEKARVLAYREVLDRGLGKPRQSIDLSAEVSTRHEHDLTARILADPAAYLLAEQLLSAASGVPGLPAGGDAGALCLDGEWREVEAIPAPAGAEPQAGGGGDGAL